MPQIVNIVSWIFLGIFFFTGLINFINPRFMWKIHEEWKATKEPPKSLFIIRRIIGFIIMCIPIAWLSFVYYMAHM
ncbi:hypothetical protein E4K67_02190 [Desulfosporosinus fructosivorans]|uniref:DUF6199 domain-containing protein n=1 Tax=Desulfosporosinus fructosivorans TaxID=2018669 RepID=A0A4Z0RBL5_9FIRM|nr:hypothetical protein E4K67_02190 [Desulfosporosinus fructosivorans]